MLTFSREISESKAMVYGNAFQSETKIFVVPRPKCDKSKMNWELEDCVYYLLGLLVVID